MLVGGIGKSFLYIIDVCIVKGYKVYEIENLDLIPLWQIQLRSICYVYLPTTRSSTRAWTPFHLSDISCRTERSVLISNSIRQTVTPCGLLDGTKGRLSKHDLVYSVDLVRC